MGTVHSRAQLDIRRRTSLCAPYQRPKCTCTSKACFEPATLEQWVREAGVPMPRPHDALFQFGGLADFLHFLDWACGLANTQERIARLGYDFCKRLQGDGTGYADVIINPTHWAAWRGTRREFDLQHCFEGILVAGGASPWIVVANRGAGLDQYRRSESARDELTQGIRAGEHDLRSDRGDPP